MTGETSAEELLEASEHGVLIDGQMMSEEELVITGETSVELGVGEEIEGVQLTKSEDEELEKPGELLVSGVTETKSVQLAFQLCTGMPLLTLPDGMLGPAVLEDSLLVVGGAKVPLAETL
jgi:hypothetical protein